jgi:hypothetical protein
MAYFRIIGGSVLGGEDGAAQRGAGRAGVQVGDWGQGGADPRNTVKRDRGE